MKKEIAIRSYESVISNLFDLTSKRPKRGDHWKNKKKNVDHGKSGITVQKLEEKKTDRQRGHTQLYIRVFIILYSYYLILSIFSTIIIFGLT